MTTEDIKEHDDVRKLLDEGKRKGVLTYDEINDTLSQQEDMDAEQIDDLLQTFADEGIQIVDKVKDTEMAAEPHVLEEAHAPRDRCSR